MFQADPKFRSNIFRVRSMVHKSLFKDENLFNLLVNLQTIPKTSQLKFKFQNLPILFKISIFPQRKTKKVVSYYNQLEPIMDKHLAASKLLCYKRQINKSQQTL